jgi:cytochrome c oxidase assembly protein subunit 11
VTRNVGTVLTVVGVVLAMTGLSFAAVPLYRLFCEATGYAGTTQRAASAPGAVERDPTITIRFNSDTANDLGWEFRPMERAVTVKPGEERIVSYRAVNRTSRPVTGTATFNVTPLKVGAYFVKVQCFCFEEQHLQPGEAVEMPVSFYVDPAMLDDASTAEVRTITLSYTMFRAKDAEKPVAERPASTRASVN